MARVRSYSETTAWANYARSPLRPLRDGGFTRLLANAVADSTASHWMPKVLGFLEGAGARAVAASMAAALDVTMAEEFGLMCYRGRLQPS